MKILIDNGLQGGVGTGIDHYSRALASALADLPDTEVFEESVAPTGNRKLARLAYLAHLDSAAYQKHIAEYDVVHYTNYAVPRKTPKGTICAVTVHDLAAFSHKETLPRVYALYNRRMVRRAIKKNPDATVCVCGCAAQLEPDTFASIDGVSFVCGTRNKEEIVEAVKHGVAGRVSV